MKRAKGYIAVVPSVDKPGQGFLRIVASNGNVVVTSELYASLSNARRAARWLSRLGAGIEVREVTRIGDRIELEKVLVEARGNED